MSLYSPNTTESQQLKLSKYLTVKKEEHFHFQFNKLRKANARLRKISKILQLNLSTYQGLLTTFKHHYHF